MAKNSIVTPYDDAGFPAMAATTATVSAAGTVTVKAGAGRLLKAVVTASAAGIVTIYDNTAGSGTVLLTIPASPTVGTVYDVNLPAVNGITVVAAATPSSVTIGYA